MFLYNSDDIKTYNTARARTSMDFPDPQEEHNNLTFLSKGQAGRDLIEYS
jgi:hypothetical protein